MNLSGCTDQLEQFATQIMNSTVLVGIDYGKVNVGIAISDIGWQISFPLKILKNTKKIITDIITAIDINSKNKIGGFVIGVPVYSNNADMYSAFSLKLYHHTKLPILLYDERYTSRLANTMLMNIGLKRKERNDIDDKISASIILDEVLHYLRLFHHTNNKSNEI